MQISAINKMSNNKFYKCRNIQKTTFKSNSGKIDLINTAIQDEIRLSKIANKIKKNRLIIDTPIFLQSLVGKVCTSFKDNKNSLDTSIFGYENVKESIYSNIILPVRGKKEITTSKFPASILLYGKNQDVSKFIKGICSEIKDDAHIINNPTLTSANFIEEIAKIRENAVKNYFNTGKRTFVIIDNIDKFLSVDVNTAKNLNIPINNADIQRLKSNERNADKIALFKGLLDDCSCLPSSENVQQCTGSALTFIMKSEAPHLISPDIIKKLDRMTSYALVMPFGENLKNTIIEIAQYYNNDYINTFDDKVWNTLIKELNPSSIKGGISLDLLQKRIKNFYAKQDKQANPVIQNLNLARILLNTDRDIEPSECFTTLKILKYLGLLEKKINSTSLEELVLKNEMGLITQKDLEFLKKELPNIKKEFEDLGNNENKKLSKKAKKRKDLLVEIIKIVEQEKL